MTDTRGDGECAFEPTNPHFATHPVRFAHVDPAGIVYYPRYFELIDAVVEDWSATVFGIGRHEMHSDKLLGLPVSDIHVKFQHPSRLGEFLTFRLSVMDVGRASVRVSLVALCGDQTRLKADLTLVLISLATMRSRAWPIHWREALIAAAANSGAEE